MSCPGSKKNLGLSFKQRCACIECSNEKLSIRRQCELLELSRSKFYSSRKQAAAKGSDLELMALIDKLYTERPCLGSRQMKRALESHGYRVNRKKIQRIMRFMCISSILPKPWTSTRNQEHHVYPYLLKNLAITRPDQVWSTDITYIQMKRGFMYLTAVIDLYSRKILGYELSNSLDTNFCAVLLTNALSKCKPEIVNTDQGCQYTSKGFTEVLKKHGVAISMDSRGRALDNIFIERFWRTFKYEFLYCHEFTTVQELMNGIREYIEYYNERRYHSAIGTTPSKAYRRESENMAA